MIAAIVVILQRPGVRNGVGEGEVYGGDKNEKRKRDREFQARLAITDLVRRVTVWEDSLDPPARPRRSPNSILDQTPSDVPPLLP